MLTLRSINMCSTKILSKPLKLFSRPNAIRYSNKSILDDLHFIKENQLNSSSIYGILNNKEMYQSTNKKFQFDLDLSVNLYKSMVSLNVMDIILYECQRQGRISFYMTNFGEEAVQIGSAAALLQDDIIYSQYRESGVLLWRGFEYTHFVNQCFGNECDKNKGRQMPVHYGSRPLNFVTISSPLGTQLPQAVGAAYGLKHHRSNLCVTCYFGEGAASEGDAHAALNFAAVLKCPVLFICRNNGYAISTPASQQYKGNGIAARGPAYGIRTIQVDGNDALAMYTVTKKARDYVVREKKPVLIEAITYRIGHHSTSDDSSAYRKNEDTSAHLKNSPILRLKKFLYDVMIWDDEKEEQWLTISRNQVMNAIFLAEKKRKPLLKDLFSDVYNQMPENLTKQWRCMEIHMEKYLESYSGTKQS